MVVDIALFLKKKKLILPLKATYSLYLFPSRLPFPGSSPQVNAEKLGATRNASENGTVSLPPPPLLLLQGHRCCRFKKKCLNSFSAHMQAWWRQIKTELRFRGNKHLRLCTGTALHRFSFSSEVWKKSRYCIELFKKLNLFCLKGLKNSWDYVLPTIYCLSFINYGKVGKSFFLFLMQKGKKSNPPKHVGLHFGGRWANFMKFEGLKEKRGLCTF